MLHWQQTTDAMRKVEKRLYKLIGRENRAHIIKNVMTYKTWKIRELHPVEKIE